VRSLIPDTDSAHRNSHCNRNSKSSCNCFCNRYCICFESVTATFTAPLRKQSQVRFLIPDTASVDVTVTQPVQYMCRLLLLWRCRVWVLFRDSNRYTAGAGYSAGCCFYSLCRLLLLWRRIQFIYLIPNFNMSFHQHHPLRIRKLTDCKPVKINPARQTASVKLNLVISRT